MRLPKWASKLWHEEKNILTAREMRAIPDVGRSFVGHRTSHGWPGQHTSPRVLKCRLLYKEYTSRQADERCNSLHGTLFDGRYAAGRYWVYYTNKEKEYESHISKRRSDGPGRPQGRGFVYGTDSEGAGQSQ